MKKRNDIKGFLWVLVCPFVLIFATENVSLAQSSLNYQLKSFVVDQGGERTQSSNHNVLDAVGQPSTLGVSNSTNYTVISGFLAGRLVSNSTSIESDNSKPYKEYQLFQNYPNPFITLTTIGFALPDAAHVRLEVHSILGRHVATLIDEYRSPGVYSVDYHGTSLSPGVYIYKIQTDQYQAVKMMNKVE